MGKGFRPEGAEGAGASVGKAVVEPRASRPGKCKGAQDKTGEKGGATFAKDLKNNGNRGELKGNLEIFIKPPVDPVENQGNKGGGMNNVKEELVGFLLWLVSI